MSIADCQEETGGRGDGEMGSVHLGLGSPLHRVSVSPLFLGRGSHQDFVEATGYVGNIRSLVMAVYYRAGVFIVG